MIYVYFVVGIVAIIVSLYYLRKNGIGRFDTAIDAKSFALYARDISIFAIAPRAIVFPRSKKEVSELVLKTLAEQKTNPEASLTVRAGGTCMSGGPLNTGTILDMTRHMKSVVINPKEKTATVEMGAYFRDIEDAAAKHGLMFPSYPSSRRICGIGGMIGNNASGEKSVRFGATSDNIASMEVVLADGSIITAAPKSLESLTDAHEEAIAVLAKKHHNALKEATGTVKKSASGYRLEKVVTDNVFNLIPLFSGAQGTLGIVTSAVLKLVPIPKHLSLVVISARDLEDIPVIVDEIYRWNPEAVETFDSNTFDKARVHLKEHADRTLAYVDGDAHIFILAEFSEDTEEATQEKAVSCFKNLQERGYVVHHVTNEVDVASIWEVRRNSFLLMRDHNEPGFKAVPCIEDVIVPVPGLAEFIKGLHGILTRRGIQYGFHGHIGDGSLRIVPVFDVKSPTLFEDIKGLMQEVFVLVKRLHGNMSADHSDGIIRSPFLKEFYGDTLYKAFEETKKIYDPNNIFNPGKKVGSKESDIEKYFDYTGPKV